MINDTPVLPIHTLDPHQHDIMILADMRGFTLYIDPEIEIVLKDIIQVHGKVVVKINWSSPGLELYVDRNIHATELALDKIVNTQRQDTAVESEETDL